MIYDYQDADGYERGDMGKGKPKTKRIYKLRFIDKKTRLAHVSSIDACSQPILEVLHAHTIIPLEKNIVR